MSSMIQITLSDNRMIWPFGGLPAVVALGVRDPPDSPVPSSPQILCTRSTGTSSPEVRSPLLRTRQRQQPHQGMRMIDRRRVVSGSTAVQDLLAGRIASTVFPIGSTIPYEQSRQLRVLVITAPQRSPPLPDVPTVREAGYPALELVDWGRHLRFGKDVRRRR
jgi:Tripartite tricarboxylate transporter family receptor